jgi:hypothetical protein
MPQPLILTWATTPLDWTQQRPRCVQSYFLGESTHTRAYPWALDFGGSADIFQAQIMDLMASLEFVRAYMDDLLIITRRTLDEHIQKMETVLTRLHDARLKVNVVMSSFCAQPWLYTNQRRDQTPTKESSSNTRAKST